MELLGRDEDAITTAGFMKKAHHHLPITTAELNRVLGKCHAKLGRPDEAQVCFEAAFADCERGHYPSLEVLARADHIKHVLDPAGRRDEGLAALGKAIKSLVLEPSAYNDVL